MTKPDHCIRVLIVDDHPVFCRGLRAILDPEPDMEVVGSAANGSDAIRLFGETKPDVTLMDIGLARGEMNGIAALQAIRVKSPNARIVMLSIRAEQDVISRAFDAGAATYLLKDTLVDELVDTIRKVHQGWTHIPPDVDRKLKSRRERPSLTPRELDVIRLAARGLRNKEIADKLKMKLTTVETHLKSIFLKLGVHERTAAVVVAIELGFVEPVSEWLDRKS